MFRCKECGCEFNTKPEYCDCGNNTFDEITLKSTHNLPDLRQLFSILIFIFCIILAIIPWTIKDKTPQQKPVVQKAKAVTTNIPDIEKIWISTPVKTETPPPIPEPVAIKQIIHPEPVALLQQQPKKTQTTKQVTKPTPKPQPVKTTTQKSLQQPKPVTPPTQQPQMQRVKTEPVKIKPLDKTPLINYKNELRVALLSKLNVPNIQGAGDCAVSFSIDATGKLLNRSFVYKSSNKSVNDEVYYMLMRLPYFKKPPEIYNGETLKLKFYINNGYYEISFI